MAETRSARFEVDAKVYRALENFVYDAVENFENKSDVFRWCLVEGLAKLSTMHDNPEGKKIARIMKDARAIELKDRVEKAVNENAMRLRISPAEYLQRIEAEVNVQS